MEAEESRGQGLVAPRPIQGSPDDLPLEFIRWPSLDGHDPTVATGRYGGSQSHLLVAAACIVIVGMLTA